ncbi:MAG: hypothetical protein U0354_10375 [Candidatus Sericytochromatia bacterium]
MDILVIVKRILTSEDSPTHKLMDIADKTAVDMAINIRDRHGQGKGSVSVICIAPIESSEIIRECYSLGVDTGYLLADPLFESLTLDQLIMLLYHGIKKVDSYDVVIMPSTSNDTVLVDIAGKLADMLNLKHIKNIDSFDGAGPTRLSLKGKKINDREIVEPPLMISFSCDAEQKIHNAMRIMKAYKKEVRVITSSEISKNDLNMDFDKVHHTHKKKIHK